MYYNLRLQMHKLCCGHVDGPATVCNGHGEVRQVIIIDILSPRVRHAEIRLPPQT